VYDGHGCNGCGLCFFVCPEPGAIRVFKLAAPERGARPEAALAAV
jgi:NAD-dependent dihydropyrimidine dehydrogenase PreA subunit